ncbi:MAG: hypothetical protein HOP29_11925 [Phycisphaerales bacterium]|nr:hypothetical protein [Phycisphaerales bacterium]
MPPRPIPASATTIPQTAPRQGVIFQDREPVEFTSLTESREEGFTREKFLYGVRARYRLGGPFFAIAKGGVATIERCRRCSRAIRVRLRPSTGDSMESGVSAGRRGRPARNSGRR